MARKRIIIAITAALMLAVSLVLSGLQPAFAHGDEKHPAQQAAAQSTQTPTQHDMNAMSPDELAWPTAESMAGMDHDARPATLSARIIRWLGTWHPAIIHFPIALLLTVAFLEAVAAIRRKPVYAASNKILLALATIGGFVAAPLGWANAGLPAPGEESALVLHRWIGTALPFVILLVWALKKPVEEASVRPAARFYQTVLAFGVLIILAQAYLGAEVTHGAGHLAF